MANYPIEPSILQPYLPYRTELDSFNGIHYVSLVGFLFTKTRVAGISFPFHQTFEEVNLRFYVRYKEGREWKRGVVFLKEIVPRHVITFVANTLYGENYATHRMKHCWDLTERGLEVEYQWMVDRQWNYIKALAEKEATELTEGSEEEFITEHYWGYTFVNESCSGTYQVTHPRWKVHKVKEHAIFCNARKLYGAAFTGALQQEPSSIFLAEGSEISVMRGSRIFAS